MRTAGILLSTLLLTASLQAANPPARKNVPANAVDPDRDYAKLKLDGKGKPLPADTADSDKARDDLDSAKAELNKAIGNITVTQAYQIDNALFKNDDYRAALLNLRRAQADYDNVRMPIFTALREDDLYKELQKRDAENQKVIQALILMGRSNFDWLFPTAVQALEVRKSMTREEIIALAQAPEVEDARQRMLAAAAKVRQMRGEYISQNAPVAQRAAPDEIAAARKKVRDAQLAYTDALAKESQYERIRMNYLAEERLTGKQPAIPGK